MLLGHYGLAFLSKRYAPKASLTLLLLATGLLDLLFVPFALLGLDTITVPAWSHGVVMSAFWSLLTYGVVQYLNKDRNTGLVLAGLVFSHFILDIISSKNPFPILLDPNLSVQVVSLYLGTPTKPFTLAILAKVEFFKLRLSKIINLFE